MGGCVIHGVGINVVAKRKKSCLRRESKLGRPARSLVTLLNVEWMYLAQDTDQWKASLVNAAMNFRVP